MEERAEIEGPVALTVDEVIITERLRRRPSRAPDYAAENRALAALAEGLTGNPNGIMQRVVELVLQLCHADSAAVSVLEHEGGEEVFRWYAAAGILARNLHGAMPRRASPCDTAVTRNRVLLFNEPERFFPALREVGPRIYENLLMPWEADGRVRGTVWAIKHSPGAMFDAEDARLLGSLSRFAGVAFSLGARARHASDERSAALNLMEDAIVARREAEQAYASLRDSEERYRELFESINEGFCTVEMLFDERGEAVDYRFLIVNPAYERLTGLRNVAGRRVSEVIPSHLEDWPRIYGEVAVWGKPLRFERFAQGLNRFFEIYAWRVGEPEQRRVAILFTDITERRQAEEAVRESEARLNSIASLVPDLLWESAPDGLTKWCNRRWMEYTGQSPEAVLGRGWIDTIHPDEREVSARFYKEAVARGEPLSQEHRLRRHDGQYRWFVVNALPLKDEAGRVVRMYGAATDIHEQRLALEAVRKSEERLQKALAIETVGVIFFNEEGEFTGANEAFCRMSGYSCEEMSSRRLRWSDLTPAEWMERSRAALDELAATGRISPYEKEYFRKDGSRFWALFAGSGISDEETVEYVIDVSSRKQAEDAFLASEERLRLVVDSVVDYAIITMDAEGLITSWNSGAERMFGYSEEEATGQHTAIIFTPEDRERGTPAQEMLAARELGRAADERWHMSKHGERFYVSGVLAPLRDSGGGITGYAKIALDLTERKELEDALRRAHDELEEGVRERTLELAEANVSLQEEVRVRASAEARIKQLLRQLVTVQEEERRRIARELHDTLGQQLTALHMNIEMIQAESEGRIRLCAQLERAQSIFNQLNSDVDFLAWELRPAALDVLGLDVALGNFVLEWSRQFGVEADYRGLGPDAPRFAPEVETNLYRILQEALQNAHKHAGADRVSVLLEQRDGRAVLIVEDNGKGYDTDDEVAANTNKGMGVTNMRERASLLGGELEIESTPGAGTTIFVRVPVGGADQARGDA